MLWVAGRNATRAQVPQLLRWQLLIGLAASPLLAIAANQSQIPSSAEGTSLRFLYEYLEFGFLFEADANIPLGYPASALAFGLVLVALGLLGVGLASRGRGGNGGPCFPQTADLASGVHRTGLARDDPGACRVLLHLGWEEDRHDYLDRPDPRHPSCSRHGRGPLLAPLGCNFPRRRMAFSDSISLSSLLTVLPVGMLLAASLAVPVYASRGALLFTPYLLVVAARGLVALVCLDVRWLVLGLVVLPGHSLSVYHYFHRPRRDYKALSERLAPRVRKSDLIFVRGNYWETTPIFYYLRADRYHFVGKDYRAAITNQPDAACVGCDLVEQATASRHGRRLARISSG